jgi:uncharacterized membrane protein
VCLCGLHRPFGRLESSLHMQNTDLNLKPIPNVFSRLVSMPGLLAGLLFFALSLQPSMLTRTGVTQGVVSGITFMIGYAFGGFGSWAWHYLEIPTPKARWWGLSRWVLLALLGLVILSEMWRYVGFQNDLRDVFGMVPISPWTWLVVIPFAFMVAGLILIISRGIRKLLRFLTRWLDKSLPARLARFLGVAALALILWGLYSGVLVNGFFAAANQIFAPRDASTNEGNEVPESPLRSGSPESLVEWEDLGRQGRAFVSTGPSVGELNEFHGDGALLPIRVYVGLKSADTLEGRVDLLLEELKRTGAFDRENLIVATTTGTGYLEPNAMAALDYVTGGNVAVAGLQYSYLPSWISLLADQEKVRTTSKVAFDKIHGYWSTLPEDSRPEIYVYGLSLGSFGAETVLRSIDILNEPIDGAVMVGPPFVNPLHDDIVDARDPGTSPAEPVFESGRTVRFTNEENLLDLPTGEWGDTRVVYVQHASDPVVWFSPSLLLTEPDWLLEGQRGDEISEDFVWRPFITMWQVLIDLAGAGGVPEGFGHLYSKQANADAWVAVLQPEGLSEEMAIELRQYLIDLGLAE